MYLFSLRHRLELKPFGIDVIVVAPGAIKSNIEVNASQVYEKLPKWKFYHPWEKFIKQRMGFSQKAGSTTSEEFATKTVAAILRKKPPAYFIIGHISYAVTLLYYVPICIRDFIFSWKFGLREDWSSSKKSV